MHRWYATGVSLVNQVQDGGVVGRYTNVLYFCPDCNGNKTIKLESHWTLRQIAGYDEYDPTTVEPPVTVTPDMVEKAKQDLTKWTGDVGS